MAFFWTTLYSLTNRKTNCLVLNSFMVNPYEVHILSANGLCKVEACDSVRTLPEVISRIRKQLDSNS